MTEVSFHDTCLSRMPALFMNPCSEPAYEPNLFTPVLLFFIVFIRQKEKQLQASCPSGKSSVKNAASTVRWLLFRVGILRFFGFGSLLFGFRLVEDLLGISSTDTTLGAAAKLPTELPESLCTILDGFLDLPVGNGMTAAYVHTRNLNSIGFPTLNSSTSCRGPRRSSDSRFRPCAPVPSRRPRKREPKRRAHRHRPADELQDPGRNRRGV